MILDRPRALVQQLVQQGELNIKTLTHYDVCEDRRNGLKIREIADRQNLSIRQVHEVIACKCPEFKR